MKVQNPLELAGQGAVHQSLSFQLHLGIIVAKSGQNRKSVERLGSEISLPCVGIGAAFQVIEKNGRDLCVPEVFLVGNELVNEIGAEIFQAQRG